MFVILIIAPSLCFTAAFPEGMPDFSKEPPPSKAPLLAVTMYDYCYSKTMDYHFDSTPPKDSNTMAASKNKAKSENSPIEQNKETGDFEKDFANLLPSLPILNTSKTPKTAQKSNLAEKGKKGRKSEPLEEETELPKEDVLTAMEQSIEKKDKPQLITAKPFEKIALHRFSGTAVDGIYQENAEPSEERVDETGNTETESQDLIP
ncbi:MAG: hypothetical protein LBQ54_08610 [Planctomycetaceae bacterium]|jgi:hypothetical protein|nr:hypothetical protein [Planctomycetaceae bacterium]